MSNESPTAPPASPREVPPVTHAAASPGDALELAKLRVCDACRIKKSKCGMERPTCGACQLRRTPCIYGTRRGKPGPRKGFVPKNRMKTAAASARPTPKSPPSSTDSRLDEEPFGFYIPLPSPRNGLRAASSRRDSAPSFPGPWHEFALLSPSPSLSSGPVTGAWPSPETEDYLLHLYFQHLQPLFPIFRRRPDRLHAAAHLPPRLRAAVFAVSSRFVPPLRAATLPTSADFARQAAELLPTNALCPDLDEIKACFLLCLYDLAESLSWSSVAEIGKLTRMADIYAHFRTLQMGPEGDDRPDEMDDDPLIVKAAETQDAEEWASVWWAIYALETCSSALASSLPATSSHLQKIPLPTLSIAQFTDATALSVSESLVADAPQYLPSSGVKLWETMSIMYSRPSCRSRNLHLGAASLMRAVTDLRCAARQLPPGGRAELARRVQELESDCAAAAFSLPPWFSNAAHDLANGETEEAHRDRLHTLLLWHCARMLNAVVSAQVGDSESPESQWQTILSRAHETVKVLQNWKPKYFAVVDPMCSYIVFVTGAVVALDLEVSPERRGSGDWDLLLLFLGNVGRHWRVGRYVADSLSNFRQTWALGASHETAVRVLARVTGPFSALYLADPRAGSDAAVAMEAGSALEGVEDSMVWLDEMLGSGFGDDFLMA